METEFCKLEIFIPTTHLEVLCEALWSADAGHIGKYDRCLSYSEVTGCFRPLKGTRPYLGKENKVCYVREYKVEVTCRTDQAGNVIRGVKQVHPYEEPVINVIPLLEVGL
ncbi:cytochrome C biogenesis protein [Anaerolentibacter hominis]|uniref:cytochrome C biogenesis protein n=1 Tax=Anaerolentibacter hominis TaxID=3079009 RepID=UPI0031B7F47A